MCLYSKSNKPNVAKKPITCYKILKGKYAYETPFMGWAVVDDIIEGKRNFKVPDKDVFGRLHTIEKTYNPYDGGDLYQIKGGYIHCFANIQKAKKAEKEYKEYFGAYEEYVEAYKEFRNLSIFECEIPAGVEYYEGLEYNGTICAKEIRFIRKID